jgi:hypothetical protein
VELAVEGPLRGSDDQAVVARAAATGSVLLSHNQRERGKFSAYVREWRRRGNRVLSVLFLPRDADDERLLLRTLLVLTWYRERPLPKPETLIWNDAAQALIHGYRPPDFTPGEIQYTLGRPSSGSEGLRGTALSRDD